MKNFNTLFLFFLLITISVFAQSPEKMSYQAVIRDASNTLVTNQSVGMQISILRNSINGSVEYTETKTVTTNINGLVTLEIGSEDTSGFSLINWSAGPYFIKIETDPDGGINYTISGTSQLMSVPFAMYAKTSGSSSLGPQGDTGPAGPTGETGTLGPAGADGVDGAVGPTGPQGLQGPAGVDGTDGAQGPIGPSGAQGPAGTDGVDGAYGPQGDIGPIGPAGADGSTPNGTQVGQMNYWNGTTWQTINPGNSGAVLQLVSGIPTWVSNADTTAPVITVLPGTDTVEQGSTWTDAGATSDGDETVTVSGTLDTSIVGTYTITYTATDAAGNTGTVTRIVTVVDTTAPVITVNPGTDTVEQGSAWTDAGATADTGETVTVSGTVDTSIAGTYTITYTATDAAGNTGTATRTVTVNLPSLSIGDLHQGGYIFYLDGNGGGLIAASTYESPTEWGCQGTEITGADGTAIGTGAQNTIDIVAGCSTSTWTSPIAADICANLSLNGYSDWFLPSMDELNLMYLNIGSGNALGLGNIGSFVGGYHWSSTEISYNNAWFQDFNNGNQVNAGKDAIARVRAVRAF